MASEGAHSQRWQRLGILAGGGDLPLELAQACQESDAFVVTLNGHADRDYTAFDHQDMSIGQIGGIAKVLKAAGCDTVCFAGYVQRPDIKSLKLDTRGLIMVPKALAAGRKGDDALIRVVVEEFESQGFAVVGADEVLSALAPSLDGGVDAPHDGPHRDDIAKACEIARKMGALDIGQGAVVADGLVLAVEAQEGTNAMLDRLVSLRAEIRGTPEQRCGVLAKMPKPMQERRVDLPTIGLDTVERCAAAGLAGIALEAGSALILEREAVERALRAHNMFLVIVEADDA